MTPSADPSGPAPDGSAVVVRPANPADVMVMAALHQATLEERWSAKSVIDVMALPSVRGHVAVAGPSLASAPVGFVIVMQAIEQAEIVSLGVLPAWRRRGVGRALIAAAAEAAREGGVAALFLEVAADNAAALGLYAALGFRPVGRRPGYYARPGGARQDAVVLQVDLFAK